MGAGKTMLVSIITGLISADSGSVKWGDIERNRRFGYVSQIGGL
jgi:ABC-type multidrug transport system ATPase subunit